jgi:crossover junction endodeoxyribonuclease RuvC
VIVLGIDPGLANTGYGLIDTAPRPGARAPSTIAAVALGVIETAPGQPIERRLAQLHDALESVVREYSPDTLALEELYFGQNARSAFAVGQARGVALLVAGRNGLACAGYTPQQVKGAVCGHGRAGKDQVARMVAALLGLPGQPRPDHATDALAVAICHANRAPLEFALQRARPAGVGSLA